MDRRSFVVGSSFAMFGAAACNAQDAITADIPLDLSGPRPTAQLIIGDAAPVTAIFDTGAAACVLRLSYAERIGAPNEGPAAAHGPNGAPIQGFRTTIARASLGQARFDGALAVALDIPLPLAGVDAIISPGVFAGRLVRFDFAASKARVLPITRENTPRASPEAYVGENTHAMLGRTPGATVHLPGSVETSAIVDTGSRGGLAFPLNLAQRVPLSEPLTPDEPMRLFGAERRAFKTRIRGLVRVGGLSLENPEARFVEGAPQAIVGIRVLRDAIIVVDPAGQRSWVLAPSVSQ